MKRRKLNRSRTSEGLMIIGRKVMIIVIGKVLSHSSSTRLLGEAELVWLEISHNATTPHQREYPGRGLVWVLGSAVNFTSTVDNRRPSPIYINTLLLSTVVPFSPVMPADRLLGTLLRSLQVYTDQQDTPR
jgi:hypothetical protein